jgi:gamma-glutamyltranspeptidase/glutathione hydrolase
MVVTTDRYATEVGVRVLESGGNAVDASVAVTFALAVVNPEAGNLGGGGFLLTRLADGTLAALDYRSAAPGRATRDMFVDGAGVPDGPSVLGHLAVGVPGSVRGTWEAHRRFGVMEWADLLEPAIVLARGFEVRERFVRSYEPHIVEALQRFPASARIFLPEGRVPRVGETFRQPELAVTLERIRDHGPDGFYRGPTADLIVAEMERGGGIVSHQDLASYEARWRRPLRFPYRDHTVVSMPPSSSGGVTLALAAGILNTFSLERLPWHGPDHIHLLAEAWKRAFADRNHYLADPDFVDVPLDVLTSPAYGQARAGDILADRATPEVEIRPGVEAFRERGHTTHFSIVDPLGNAASVTTTLNTWYGSKVVATGTGVLLNNEMDDFTAKPGVPNFFGLVQGEANAIAPGKRMLSAMTPTLLLDPTGGLRMVVGAPGGATIITTVFQIVSNVLDHGMSLSRAVGAPRVHHQHLPDEIRHEPGGLTPAVVQALEDRGHTVVPHDEAFGDAQTILVDGSGSLHGQSDPRRGGVAAGPA